MPSLDGAQWLGDGSHIVPEPSHVPSESCGSASTAAMRQSPRTGGVDNRHLFSHGSAGHKSKVNVLAGPRSHTLGGKLLPCLSQPLVALGCPALWQPHCVSDRVLLQSLLHVSVSSCSILPPVGTPVMVGGATLMTSPGCEPLQKPYFPIR